MRSLAKVWRLFLMIFCQKRWRTRSSRPNLKNILALRVSRAYEHRNDSLNLETAFDYYESSSCNISDGAKHSRRRYYSHDKGRRLGARKIQPGQRTDHLVDRCCCNGTSIQPWGESLLTPGHEESVHCGWHLKVPVWRLVKAREGYHRDQQVDEKWLPTTFQDTSWW